MSFATRCDKCGKSYYVGPGEPEHICVTKPVTPVKSVTENVTLDAHEQRIMSAALKRSGRKVCSECGRPYPMTAAERKRRSRARKK